MNVRVQLVCAWCAVATVVVTLGGWLIAGVLPFPPAANDSQVEIVEFYSEDRDLVRLGLLLSSVGVCFVGPLVALISVQLMRMEGRSPVLTVLQAVSGAVTWVMLIVPMIMMNAAAFRPERDPEITQTLNDLAWLLFLTPIGPFIIQNVTIGVAVLADRSPKPVLPRWVGYANFWVGSLFIPAALAYFFKSGPFAWHGALVFYLGTAAYGGWLLLMSFALRRAVLEQDAEQVAERVSSPAPS